MNKTFTTIEQSNLLTNKGLSIDTADGYYVLGLNGYTLHSIDEVGYTPSNFLLNLKNDNLIPAWSIDKLIELITVNIK